MIIEILTIGSELFHGIVRNTNLDLVAGLLAEIGLVPAYHTTVGDDAERMGEVFRAAAHRADAVIATGGLGPTPDDITRRVIATAFRRRLVLDQAVLDRIRARFRERGLEMPPINEAQALIPRGGNVIANDRGSAPGIHLTQGRCDIFILPGVPSEAEQMLRDYVIPFLRSRNPGAQSGIRVVHTIGISESMLAERLQGFEREEPDLSLGFLARSGGGVDLYVTATSTDAIWLQGALDRAERKLIECAGPHVFGRGSGTLSEAVGEALIQRGATIATAESFTAGGIATALTATSGSSRYYRGGVVAYSNELKVSLLGVSPETLRRHGAVSAEVVREMARGARERLGSDCAVSTTGIAGPEGGSAEKPVGLAFLGFSGPGGEIAERHVFGGSRADIMTRASAYALDLVRRSLLATVWSEPSSRS